MTRRRTLLTALTAGTVGTAGCLGLFGGGGEESAGEQETIAAGTTDVATTAVSTQETVAESTESTATESVGVRFDAEFDGLSECGWACRSLSYTVQNTGDASATDVEVDISVRSPGEGGETLYEGSQSLDDIDGQRQRSATTPLEFDQSARETLRANDGSVVVALTVAEADGTSANFSTERTVELAPAREAIQFEMLLNELTECGRACRTADYTVQNRGEAPATAVEARIRVYTPDRDGEQVYDDTQTVGDLGASTERDLVKDVDVGVVDGTKIRDNDGEIDIRVNLSSAEEATAEFTFDRVLDV